MSHTFELSSTISKPITCTNADNLRFKFLYRKFCNNIGIKEFWNFGLFYTKKGADTICINLEENYSTTEYLHQRPTVNIPLTLGIVTYPLSLTKEIWVSASVHLFFIDIHNREKKSNFNALRTIETDAIESLLLERQSDIKFPITKREIKEENEQRLKAIKDKFNILSEWELQRKYFEILDKGNFEIVTGESVCDKNNTTISMTAKNLIWKKKNCTSTYPWNEIKYEIKGKVCTISSLSNDKACKKDKKKLEFNSENSAKHFHYLTEEHKNQYDISSMASYDSDFENIKDYAISEQRWIENTRSLNAELASCKSNIQALETKIIKDKDLHDENIKKNKDLCTENENLQKINSEILKDKFELSKKLKRISKNNTDLKKKLLILKTQKRNLEIKNKKNDLSEKNDFKRLLENLADLIEKIPKRFGFGVESVMIMESDHYSTLTDDTTDETDTKALGACGGSYTQVTYDVVAHQSSETETITPGHVQNMKRQFEGASMTQYGDL